MDIRETQRAWRNHKNQNELPDNDVKVAIIGSMTTEQLEPYIGKYLLDRDFKSPEIAIGPFNQIQQICRDHKSFFSQTPDAIIILWRIEDLFQNIEEKIDTIIDGLSDLTNSIQFLREHYNGTLIVSSPPYPTSPSFDPTGINKSSPTNLYSRICQHWQENIETLDNIQTLDINALFLKNGIDNIYDKRKWYLYRQPWNEIFCATLGRHIGRMVSAQKRSTKKCIILDADNTLWGGVIGEDGIKGISLGEDFPGNTYQEFQKHLLHLQKHGIMLAVASKNNEDDFFEVLDCHDAMVLKREHFLSFQVNWDSKTKGIHAIAKELNISTDAIIFIDDSPKEIAEVQSAISDITCIIVPEELSDLPYLLTNTDFFDHLSLTKEDLKRNEMMNASKSRDKIKSTMSEEDFKKSLELEMTFSIAQNQHIARITQLINKTNQFNLTTIRRTHEEVESLITSKQHKVICMDLRDKFGEYGLVGVAILQKQDKQCIIDTLLISCRVLGRDAETGFLYQIAQIAKNWGCLMLKGQYIPTNKNMLVENLYKDHGFVRKKGKSFWQIEIDNVFETPKHIKISNDIQTNKRRNKT